MFSFHRCYWTVFLSGWTILHSHQKLSDRNPIQSSLVKKCIGSHNQTMGQGRVKLPQGSGRPCKALSACQHHPVYRLVSSMCQPDLTFCSSTNWSNLDSAPTLENLWLAASIRTTELEEGMSNSPRGQVELSLDCMGAVCCKGSAVQWREQSGDVRGLDSIPSSVAPCSEPRDPVQLLQTKCLCPPQNLYAET